MAGSAATIALVTPAEGEGATRESIHYDLGQLTAHIMLAAADLGIGSGHAKVGDQELAARILGLPDDRVCPWLIAMGYPKDRPLRPILRPNRRAFEDMVHRGGW